MNKMKGGYQIPILLAHDYNSPPVGYVAFSEDQVRGYGITEEMLSGMIIAPGYIPKRINEKGETLEVELLEMSLVPAPRNWQEN